MANTIVTMAMLLASGATGWQGYPTQAPYTSVTPNHSIGHPGGRVVLDGPGYGWGFPNGSPDGYGWVDYGTALPLGANRTPDYFFPRYFSALPSQMFLQSYYNPYVTRGQRYIAYAGCGGDHPMGGPPAAPALTPVHPYQEAIGTGPKVRVPAFTGRVEAPPTNTTGNTGLTP